MDNLVTFGSKITAKKPGTRPTTTNPWTYDGIFLGYGASQDNIKYFDIHTGTDKTARHDSKDELQYGDDPTNRSPAASHLLSVFTEDDHTNHSTSREPEKLTFDIKDLRQANPENIVEQILKDSPLSYTTAAAARVTAKINRTKFQRPDIAALIPELDTLDISTNMYMQETSHTLPLLNTNSIHPTMGFITSPHPDIANAIEL